MAHNKKALDFRQFLSTLSYYIILYYIKLSVYETFFFILNKSKLE